MIPENILMVFDLSPVKITEIKAIKRNIYAGVPVVIGSGGVEKIIELELNTEEKENFKKSVEAVKELYNAAKKIDTSL